MSSQKRRSKWLISLVILAGLVIGVPVLLRMLRPSPVIATEKIVAVERGDIARSVVAIGRVEPRSKVEVKSKANGILQALLVDVGDTVDEGQVLAELDKENLQAQVREAQATLQAEHANLGDGSKARRGLRRRFPQTQQ